MTTYLIPGSSDDDPDSDETADGPDAGRSRSRGSKRTRKSRDNPFPSERECLEQLHRLNGLVAIGMLTTNKANTMRANLKEILTYHRQNQNMSDGRKLADNDLLELARGNPKLVSQLEPFLTDDQIDMLMFDREEEGAG